MKNTLLFALGLSAAAAALTPAFGQVYQWKDENGRTVVSDTPPPGKYKVQRNLGGATPPSASAPATASSTAAAPKTMAEKDMEFKTRQLEAKEKADKEAKEQAAALQRKENCSQAQQAVRTLESNQGIATINAKGEREYLDGKQRQAETERARQSAAAWCK